VKNHIARILNRLDANSSLEAVATARRSGLLQAVCAENAVARGEVVASAS
jgi:hypothetical protein